MNYDAEKLIPILQLQSNKYTSFESSSLSYETAQVLMEGIIYTLDENFKDTTIPVTLVGYDDYMQLFKSGQELIIEKINRARQIYQIIAKRFNDYGVENFHDTVMNGMPAFFTNYDHQFNPQSHLLTLDYPPLVPINNMSGIDLIEVYLENINLELKFLSFFPDSAIANVLNAVTHDYKELYMDNICYPVIFMAVFCLIADKSISSLMLEPNDNEVITDYFRNDNKEGIRNEALKYISLICNKFQLDNTYFVTIAHDFSIRWKTYLDLIVI